MRRPLLLAGALASVVLTVGYLTVGPAAQPAAATPRAERWVLAIGDPLDVPREGVAERMFGFLLHVDESGAPRLERTWTVRGVPPAYREKPDFGRIYRWELLDASGRSLATGRHFDLTAIWVPELEGGCEKKILGPHDLMIRTPYAEGAVSLALTIEGTRTDVEEVN